MPVQSKSDTQSGGKSEHTFGDVQALKENLGGRSISGGSSLVISEIGCNVFRLFGTVVLARLLTPEHFGLVTMITALTAFAETFKDLGLGMATMQRQKITHEQISTLFWINTGIGVLLMLILAGASPFISWFYGDHRLLWIALAISSTFLFGGLTVQHQALLRREMRFSRLAFIQVFATGLSTTIGVIMAWWGFEYWSLVVKEVSRAVIQTCATWFMSHWWPGLPVRGSGVRKMFEMGSHLTGFNILAFASRNLDQVLLGKFWGASSVGLYKQAGLLLQMPVSLFSFAIIYVMTPALSALQSDVERYRSYYRRAISFLAFGFMPLIAFIAVYADSVISLILGEKWMASSVILQILAIGAVVDPVASTCGIVMVTNAKTKEYLHVGIAQAVLVSITVLISIHWGIIGIAMGYVLYTLLTLPLLVWYSFRGTPIAPSMFFEAIRYPAIATAVMTLFLLGVRHFIHLHNAFLDLACAGILAGSFYCVLWTVVPDGKRRLAEYWSHFLTAVNAIRSRIFVPVSQASS